MHECTQTGPAPASTADQPPGDVERRYAATLIEHERAVHRQAEVLSAGQNQLLEMIAQGQPLKQTLAGLMRLIESQSDGVLCSTLLLDEDGVHIRPGAAPSLPEQYTRQLDGLAIGPAVGSCGTAMFRKEQVIVTDMLGDPLWAPYTGLIEPYGLRACWSTPIFLNRDQLLGAFAMYHRTVRSPSAHDLQLIAVATHLAGIAIERTRRGDELARHREHLEELVLQRTAELRDAKERADAINRSLSAANQDLANALNNLSITQVELMRRDKLAALGALVAGVAHELNTPLGNCLMAATSLSGQARAFAELSAAGLKRSELDGFVGDTVYASDVLVRNLTRAADLVTSFKQVAVDQTSSQRRSFALADYIADLMLTLRPSPMHSAVVIEQHIGAALQMDSYPGPLGQVVTNLVDNALLHGFAGRASGAIVISARLDAPGWIALTVRDDGCGIAPEHQTRIYDPFFTTRRNAGGTGLGLHIAHNIVTGLLGGRIAFHSQPGQGTSFVLSLPLLAPSIGVAAPASAT